MTIRNLGGVGRLGLTQAMGVPSRSLYILTFIAEDGQSYILTFNGLDGTDYIAKGSI